MTRWRKACIARGHRNVYQDRRAGGVGAAWFADIAQPGDIVVCLGAGTITQWAYALPGQLAEPSTSKAATRLMQRLDGEALLKRLAAGARPARAQCAAAPI